MRSSDPLPDVDVLRAATPGCVDRVHLNNAGAGLLSSATLRAMVEHLELEARIGGYEAADRESDRIRDTYRLVAELLGGHDDEVALFDNATRAWNAAVYSLRFGPGDRILTGRCEYGSNVLAYLQIAARTGAEVVVVPDDENGALDVRELEHLIDDRTRLVGISHVPTSGGLVNPAAEVGRVCRAAGVPFMLDATQSVGQFPIDVRAIGCDFLAATGRKFLRGPRGIGFLWVARSALELLDPHVTEIQAATWDGARGFAWHDGATRFETWEKNYSAVLGLGSAVRQALDVGLEWAGRRSSMLAARLRAGLDGIDGVVTHDLGAAPCAIVTAAVREVPAPMVARELALQGINVTVTVPEHTQFDTEVRAVHPLVRLSPHYYNTEAEVEGAIEAVGRLAA